MDPEQRDALRFRNAQRSITCGKCGAIGLDERDGSEIGGLPGIRYKVCGGCGWTRAIVKRRPRRRLP